MDGLDRMLEYEHRMEMREVEAIASKIMKLNKRQIAVLAKHYGVVHYEDFMESGYWARDGKRDLAVEIATSVQEREEGYRFV